MASPIDTYVATLIDPFRVDQLQPKIFDNRFDFSNGVRFRTTGNITLDATGSPTYLVFFPGYSNMLAWKKAADVAFATHTLFPMHVESATNRGLIRNLRYVSAGMKLALMNSADQNEGHWEAVRIPYQDMPANWAYSDQAAPVGEDWGLLPDPALSVNMSNYRSFQTGKLKDLERFMFKLNSLKQTSRDYDTAFANAPLVNQALDEQLDIIVIKLFGRVDVAVPSVVRYDIVSNQEVVYKEETPLHRLATPSIYIAEMDQILARSNFKLPAIQIA